MSIKFLYSSEKTNSFRPVPWHWSLEKFPAYRGAGARYGAFLAVGKGYQPAFAGNGPASDGYSNPTLAFDPTPTKLIRTREKQTLLLVPCDAKEDEQVMLITLRGGFRGGYSRVEVVGGEILFERSGNVHCCPTAHLIVRLTHPNGYVFAETGRRCSVGLVEVFSWEGYETFPTEEFEVWRESQAPDTSDSSKAEARAKVEEERVAKAAARDARLAAEQASRSAKASGRYDQRIAALQARVDVLYAAEAPSRAPLKFEDTFFGLGYTADLPYTDESFGSVEAKVVEMEARLVARDRRQAELAEKSADFRALLLRVEALGLTLSFGDEKVNWEGGSYYGGFTYTQEGLNSFEADLIRKEEEKAEEERAEAVAKAKALAEAEAATLGLPADVTIWRRMGGVNNRGNGWVIRPDGTERQADSEPGQGNLVWKQILPGELVLRYHQADRYDIAHCEVVHRPEAVTREQLIAAKQIEEDMEAAENAFGLDDRLGKLLERRAVAIEEAMAELPQALWPDDGWTLEVLASANGLALYKDARSWVNHAAPFPEWCEGREAQVVYELPAADGTLQVVAYDKWGAWNLNLWWRESTEVAPAASSSDEPEQTGASLEDLAAFFNNGRN